VAVVLAEVQQTLDILLASLLLLGHWLLQSVVVLGQDLAVSMLMMAVLAVVGQWILQMERELLVKVMKVALEDRIKAVAVAVALERKGWLGMSIMVVVAEEVSTQK
jgi:hypothetical protein